MNWMRSYIINALRVAVFIGFVLIFILNLCMPRIDRPGNGVLDLWYKQPIVSVYLPSQNQTNHCAQGYESISINSTISSISGGPCGCVQNEYSYRSTNHSCSPCTANVCTSLPVLHAVESQLWRRSTICIKRSGQASVTTKRGWLDTLERIYRPQPDSHDSCPLGYRKCGEEVGTESSAICFPFNSECPITNLMILPATQIPPSNENWETAGTFIENNHILYVRREFRDELPIVDLVVKLAEHNQMGENKRGICHEGSNQIVFGPINADLSSLWSYNITLPHVCDIVDTRYSLVDTLSLQDHFLQNLQLAEPACAGFALYSLSDPRYQPALDPDYLNSGVECDSDARYPCIRAPYQRTDCAAGDNICDGVMHQNICGAYTHAVRSAFQPIANVTIGVYFAREIKWTTNCSVTQDGVLALCGWFVLHFIVGVFAMVIWFTSAIVPRNLGYMFAYEECIVILLMLGLDLYSTYKLQAIYDSVKTESCTDSFTQMMVLSSWRHGKSVETDLYAIGVLVSLIALESAIRAALTLRHNKLVWRQFYYGWDWDLEPLHAAAPPTMSDNQCTFTVTGNRQVRKTLGY